MMDYNLFKTVAAERIKLSLPREYQSYEVKLSTVRKINEEKDVLNLMPPENSGTVLLPNIYLDDMYELLQECDDLEEVLDHMADIIVNFTGMKMPGLDSLENLDFASKLDCLTMNLINTEMNLEMLENVPHMDFLDLSIVYRFIICEEGDGFGTILLTNELMELLPDGLDTSLEEIHRRAYENTLRMFPVKITEPFTNFFMMSNEKFVGGAATIVCSEGTDMLAKKIGDDFYILPASIHEVYAVAAKNHDIRELLCILEEGNRMCIDSREMLSTSIYHYNIETRELTIAGSYVTA